MWCWRRMEKISWTDRMKNEKVLPRGEKETILSRTMRDVKLPPRSKWELRSSGLLHMLRNACCVITQYSAVLMPRSSMTRRKVNYIGHILHRKCLLKHVIEVQLEGRIEVTGRRGRRCKLLLYASKMRVYWTLKEAAVDSILWRTGCGRGCGHVARQTSWLWAAVCDKPHNSCCSKCRVWLTLGFKQLKGICKSEANLAWDVFVTVHTRTALPVLHTTVVLNLINI